MQPASSDRFLNSTSDSFPASDDQTPAPRNFGSHYPQVQRAGPQDMYPPQLPPQSAGGITRVTPQMSGYPPMVHDRSFTLAQQQQAAAAAAAAWMMHPYQQQMAQEAMSMYHHHHPQGIMNQQQQLTFLQRQQHAVAAAAYAYQQQQEAFLYQRDQYTGHRHSAPLTTDSGCIDGQDSRMSYGIISSLDNKSNLSVTSDCFGPNKMWATDAITGHGQQRQVGRRLLTWFDYRIKMAQRFDHDTLRKTHCRSTKQHFDDWVSVYWLTLPNTVAGGPIVASPHRVCIRRSVSGKVPRRAGGGGQSLRPQQWRDRHGTYPGACTGYILMQPFYQPTATGCCLIQFRG